MMLGAMPPGLIRSAFAGAGAPAAPAAPAMPQRTAGPVMFNPGSYRAMPFTPGPAATPAAPTMPQRTAGPVMFNPGMNAPSAPQASGMPRYNAFANQLAQAKMLRGY